MKQNWEIKKLGDICKIRTGKKDVNQGNPDGKYPFFTCAREHTFSDGYSFDDEALLIAGNGDVGSVSYYKGKFEAYQRTYVLTGFSNILPNFLFYILDSFLKQKMSAQKLGNTMPYIKLGMLAEFEIPLPPLSEQKRIVSILDKLFADIEKAKTNAEKNLKNSEKLFESCLQSMFINKGVEWSKKMLGDVCKISSKLIDPKKSEFQNLVHIGAGNIEFKKGTLINLKTAKEEKLISGKFLFNKGVILYSKIRPYLMKVVRCKFDGLCSADIYPLEPIKSEITKDFLYYLLLTKDFTDYAILGSQRAGMPKVNREHLFAYNFYAPTVSVQRSIADKLDIVAEKTKKLENIYKQKINNLEELKKSISQKAFSGDL